MEALLCRGARLTAAGGHSRGHRGATPATIPVLMPVLKVVTAGATVSRVSPKLGAPPAAADAAVRARWRWRPDGPPVLLEGRNHHHTRAVPVRGCMTCQASPVLRDTRQSRQQRPYKQRQHQEQLWVRVVFVLCLGNAAQFLEQSLPTESVGGAHPTTSPGPERCCRLPGTIPSALC